MELVRKGRGVGTERSWSWFGKVVELVRIGRGVGTVTFPNQLDGYNHYLIGKKPCYAEGRIMDDKMIQTSDNKNPVGIRRKDSKPFSQLTRKAQQKSFWSTTPHAGQLLFTPPT